MLFAQLAAVADTVLVRQVPPVRTGFEQLVFVASGLTSVLTLGVVLMVLLLLLGMRASAQQLQAKLEELLRELRPLAQNANAASEDARQAATAVKEMVMESRVTVEVANERVRDTIDGLADRVDDLSDLLGRVHHAGERVATVAATAAGGIKAGARFLGFGRKRRKKRKASKGPRLRRRD